MRYPDDLEPDLPDERLEQLVVDSAMMIEAAAKIRDGNRMLADLTDREPPAVDGCDSSWYRNEQRSAERALGMLTKLHDARLSLANKRKAYKHSFGSVIPVADAIAAWCREQNLDPATVQVLDGVPYLTLKGLATLAARRQEQHG